MAKDRKIEGLTGKAPVPKGRGKDVHEAVRSGLAKHKPKKGNFPVVRKGRGK